MKSSTAIKLLIGVDIIALVATCLLGSALIFNPGLNLEPALGASASIFVVTEVLRRYAPSVFDLEGKNLTAADRIHHQETMRKDFEPKIREKRRKGLCYEVIIRHVNRSGDYPNINTGDKGISSWFKAEMIETYHAGIRLLLSINMLSICPDGFRYTDHSLGEEGNEKGFLFGEINYSSIEYVNWEGDEYYNFPIIFCHFDRKGMPYENLVFDREVGELHGRTIFETIATLEDVKLNSSGISGAGYA